MRAGYAGEDCPKVSGMLRVNWIGKGHSHRIKFMQKF